MTTGFSIAPLTTRGVLRVAGEERVAFLQGLLTNDVTGLTPGGGAVYAWLLTAQGRFLHEMFVLDDGEALLLETEADRRADLLKRLRMYKLRAKVELADVTESFSVWAGWGQPEHAFPELALAFRDPRVPALGFRALLPSGATLHPNATMADWDRHRLALGVPDGSRDLAPEQALLVESNLDFLHGVTWDKGCYVGQELTARTHFRGLVKKRLFPVTLSGGDVAPGTPVVNDSGREVGEMRSSEGMHGLALLRLDAVRAGGVLRAGETGVTPVVPAWAPNLAGGDPTDETIDA